MRKIKRSLVRDLRNGVKILGIAIATVWANKLLEAKTYDAELTGSIAQFLDAKYGEDTTEIGKEWRIISVKDSISAADVYGFLDRYWDAREAVEEMCPTCVLGLAEIIRQNGGGSSGNGSVQNQTSTGYTEGPQPQAQKTEISEEAKKFFSKKIEVRGERMSALEYLIKCGYLPGEIEGIYEKIKKDWGKEIANLKLNPEFLDAYAQEVTGRVLPYPVKQKEPRLTQAQRDSLSRWAVDTLHVVFSKSLGATGKMWKAYLVKEDRYDLDAIYRFCVDVLSLCNKNETKVVREVMGKIHPYTSDYRKTKEQMNGN